MSSVSEESKSGDLSYGHTLHCVVRAPLDGEALQLAVMAAVRGDRILLLQDGVRAAVAGAVVLPHGVRGYVLMADLIVRGLDPQQLDGFTAVDATGFVALAAAATRQVCWA